MSLSEAAVGDIPHPPESSQSLVVATSESARQKRKITALEEKLQILESGHAVKQRETNYYVLKGRAIRRTVTLFDNIEDLICENDRQCDLGNEDENTTDKQDCLQTGYTVLNHALLWFHPRASDLEYDDYSYMLKKPDSPIDPKDKHYCGFINNMCGRLLCPTELDWNSPIIRAGIRDRADGYIMTEMFWPAFLTLLLQAFKAIFMSPSSAREVTTDGDAADKVKTHIAQIIKMHAVMAHSIAYVACQLRFALSSVSSWRSVDGDFNYIPFWQNIVDFFKQPPGRAAQQRVTQLLAWWTRKVFGTSRRAELSDGAKARMSVNTLTRQRAQLDNALFDSE
ncbi:hypothetical protein BDR06DRAFT_1005342 [Suillus hirtellus]|nr:hypothetical protein BDR06DRAFT_1005342 [Suillus hirtellus]